METSIYTKVQKISLLYDLLNGMSKYKDGILNNM